MAMADDGTLIKDEDFRPDRQLITSQSSKTRTRRRQALPQKTWAAWFINNVLRIGVWYSIVTVLFRCPSETNSLTTTSPKICTPYLNAKTYVHPFVGPYYDRYAGPYLEKAKPYAEAASTHIIRPVTVLAIDNYNKHAAPQVTKAKVFTTSQWEKKALPHLHKAQGAVQQVYDDNLALPLQKASEVTTPYYTSARDNARSVHAKHIIPAIAYSQPHLHTAYTNVHKFVLEKGLPFMRHAWTHAVIFVDGTLWPFLKKVYGDNVKPQVVMIGERIAKYQEGRKLQSAMDQIDVSSTESLSNIVQESTMSQSTSTLEHISASAIDMSSSVAPAHTSSVATDETVKEDLVKWQQKFAVAADRGTDDLKERIEEIINSMVKSDLSEGHGLANALEKTVEVELDSIKSKINAITSALPEDDTLANAPAEAEVLQAMREAGLRVKEKAKNVRAWADAFKKDLTRRTELATESTLHVLDDIRDLGLQEIGMRWAWMDGVTYKHWQKYHDLKRKFADWRSEVREVALTNPAMTDAHEQADKLLEQSMAVTEHAAKELIRLRDVSKWKIAARDSTNDFDTRAVPVVVAAASGASSMAQDIKEAIMGTAPSNVDSLSSVASEKSVTASSSASSFASTTGPILASQVSSSASSAASGISAAAEGLASDVSSVILSTKSDSLDSLSSKLPKIASSAIDSGSSMKASATAGPSEGFLSSASLVADSVSSSASSAVVSASASQKLQEAINHAGDQVADFTSSLTASSSSSVMY